MTLVWGVPLIPGGALVTAELANLAVDQCELVDQRFTLIAPDNYRGDFLEVKLWGKRGAGARRRVALRRGRAEEPALAPPRPASAPRTHAAPSVA